MYTCTSISNSSLLLVYYDTRNTRIRRDENTRNSRQIYYSDAGWLSKYGLHWMHNPCKLLLTRCYRVDAWLRCFSFLLLTFTNYTRLLFRNCVETSAILGETRYHPREEGIVNHGNCATFESVESELRCLDRGIQKGFQDLGKVVEFLREDIFYEKSVFPFCGISILLSFFLSFFLVMKIQFLFLEDEIYLCVLKEKKNVGKIFFVWWAKENF